MRIWVDLPETLAERLRASGQDPSAAALEALAIDSYRVGQLTAHELCEVLGIPSRTALDGLLKAHGVPLEYTIDEFEAEREAIDRH
jgi:Uncharacterised protein family (UPF0175)